MASFSTDCVLCPRLAAFLSEVRIDYPSYFARPVPSFGDANARLVIVGLAPGMHGANASGRPFTGDHAGIILYRTLHKFGFASAAESQSADDGLCLIGCRSPARLLLRELPGGEKLAALDLSGDVDDLFWDARRRRLMAACGGGFVDVFEREGKGLGGRTRVATAPGARTSLFVPERDRLYVAAPHRGGEPARILVFAPED